MIMTNMTEAAGLPPVETASEEEPKPELEEKKPDAQEPPKEDPEALKAWALGVAAQDGWTPPGKTAPAPDAGPKFDLIEGTDVPKPPQWAKWEEDGNETAMESYLAAVQAVRMESAPKAREADEKVKRIEGMMARQSCLGGAASMLDEESKPYLPQALDALEKMLGEPLTTDHPLARQMLSDRAKLLALEAKVKKPVGESVPTQAQSARPTNELRKEWMPLLVKAGYPGAGDKMTDAEFKDALKFLGEE